MADDLILERLEKRFGGNPVTRGVSLAVRTSEIVALLGPSGSGKTTILRLVAGFETPDAGAIRVGGEDVTRVPPQSRRFGMVFQHYALFPHMTVGENVAFGLEAQGLPAPRAASAAWPRRSPPSTSPASRAARSRSSPAASSSASRWRARSRRGRASCCSTSRSRISIRRCARGRAAS